MKIDLDKSVHPHNWVKGKPLGVHVQPGRPELERQPGLTVREELWARFAAAALPPVMGDPSPDYSYQERASDVCQMADAMIAAIEAREGEGD